jgi:hypothetical protein
VTFRCTSLETDSHRGAEQSDLARETCGNPFAYD